MKIERMTEYAQFNLRLIRDQGTQAEQTRKLVEKMKQLQQECQATLAKPSEHLQRFHNAMKKLDII